MRQPHVGEAARPEGHWDWVFGLHLRTLVGETQHWDIRAHVHPVVLAERGADVLPGFLRIS